MLFWIFLVLLIVVVGIVAYTQLSGYGDGFDAFMASVLTLLFGGIVGGAIIGILLSTNGHNVEHVKSSEETLKLKALTNDSKLAGRSYYLGSYIGQYRTLNYITETNGAVRVESAFASSSTIYEDTPQNPTVKVEEYKKRLSWLLPWDLSGYTTYEFHVPSGSVLEGYSIDNNK